MRKQTVLLLACSALTFTCLPMAAQAPPAAGADRPMATLKVKAREVVLPVTVRDKKGELAPNMTAADFTLTEDGRPQTIKSFSRESDLPFLVGLLVDTSRSVAAAMENERKAAGKFVDQMLPEDAKGAKESNKAFLIHFDREVELLEDLTAERAELHRELEGMGPTARERDSASGPETSSDDRQRPRGTPGMGTQLYDAIFLAADEMLKSKEGRKALIVFSDGQDRGSKENLNDAIDAADRANVAVYTVYFKGEPERRMSEGVPSSGRRGGGFPGGGGYPGGGYPGGGGGYPSGGGRPQGGDRGSKIDGERIMAQIATRTGGRYFVAKKKDNLEEIYSAIAEELRGQYVLTYTPDKPDNDDEFHKVVVKAKNADLIVVTREGYYSGEK